uniref:Uncharacterized protein n=1 Tax=Anopheles atroparvus TaxID=41427 RepID=A0A182IRK5_ANOAO
MTMHDAARIHKDTGKCGPQNGRQEEQEMGSENVVTKARGAVVTYKSGFCLRKGRKKGSPSRRREDEDEAGKPTKASRGLQENVRQEIRAEERERMTGAKHNGQENTNLKLKRTLKRQEPTGVFVLGFPWSVKVCWTVVRRLDVSANSAPTSSDSRTPSRYQDSFAPGHPLRETQRIVTFLPNSNSPLLLSTLLASSILGGSGATA